MRNLTKVLALLLALIMVVSAFAGCTDKKENPDKENPPVGGGEETPSVDKDPEDEYGWNDTPMVIGYAPFNSKFSPFFSETAYDQDVYAMTQIGLLTSDRTGAIILKGIEGETIPYNGTDYTYYGPADLVITENEDGTVYYDFTLRDDIKYSDGEPLTIDDVIFTMYVLCDPTYDGSSTLFAQPIEGMQAYRSGVEKRLDLILKAGPDGYTETDWYTQEQYDALWTAIDAGGLKFAQSIVDYVLAAYGEAYGAVDFPTAAALWGYEAADANELWGKIVETYGYDLSDNGINYEKAETSITDFVSGEIGDKWSEYTAGVVTGESAPSITGIQKTGENTLRIVMTEVDATAIYQLGVSIAPLHYYGDKALYDYENNKFGFPKGDLSSVRAKTTQPLGAGPYKFLKFENGVVYFEANENYYRGVPKTHYVNFMECTADDDKLNGVLTGTIDVTDPSFSNETIKAIETANGGTLNGDKVYVNTVDNLGYGYIGMCAKVMNVGGEPASDASKNLRKAFGTILSVYRDVSIDSYYGDRASVINYPISNTSWAAPQSTDDGYKVAFSVDVDGNDIYTSDMDAEAKYAAAAKAALGYFEAAGYTVADGKVTAAPAGASLEYEAWIPADGAGDHPSFMILTEARDAFAEIGITLKIKDLTNSSELWTALEAQQVAMWAAAWGATVDPDMYQIYFSGDETHAAGGSNYMYAIDDANLNEMILAARQSTDQTYRKAMYKACLDTVIDWAVEIPVYQRQNAIIFSAERVNLDTITPDITTFYGWMSEVENTTVVAK